MKRKDNFKEAENLDKNKGMEMSSKWKWQNEEIFMNVDESLV